jgi:hypothetical protein
MLQVYAAVGARLGGAVGNVRTDQGLHNKAETIAEIYRYECTIIGVVYFLPRIFVGKKRILSQKTTKAAILLGLRDKMLGYETDAFIAEVEAELLEDMSDFRDIHWGLLRGMSWLNWGGVVETCLMQSTGEVSYRWDFLTLPLYRDVLYGVRMNTERWMEIDANCDLFLTDVENNLRLLTKPESGVHNTYRGDGDDCDVRIKNPVQWRLVMTRLGDMITSVEKMAKFFFEIASGTYISESRRDLGILITQFETGMALLQEGERSIDLPSPPFYSLVLGLSNVMLVRFP